jgi:Zn-dependent protease
MLPAPMFDLQNLLENLLIIPPLILSLSVHEWAHAYSAYRLGDDTAQRLGRMTLNPISHIDPIGTLLFPLLGVPFGWAKPVPVNPARFTRKMSMRTGMMLTAAAGPFSNLILAVVCAAIIGVLVRFSLGTVGVYELLKTAFVMNIALAIFNMLPIPPLDGSRVADGLMPSSLRPRWERFASYGPFVLLALIVVNYATKGAVLGWAFAPAGPLLQAVVTAIAL